MGKVSASNLLFCIAVFKMPLIMKRQNILKKIPKLLKVGFYIVTNCLSVCFGICWFLYSCKNAFILPGLVYTHVSSTFHCIF